MLNKPLLQEMLDQRYVSMQKHPTVDFWIYNYTPSAQYDKVWNEVTLKCRGLILDKNHNVIARPFEKFFNLEEVKDIPIENFEVFTKLDGSLGILYWLNDSPYIATRGSFTSPQSKVATELLQSQYAHAIPRLKRDRTYLFEIIYPENRIVIDYANEKKLVLLAIIDNATGQDLPLEDIGFPVVDKHDGITDFAVLKSLDEPNKEGFVVRFNSGLRIKIKFQEYIRLHRIITTVSNKTIWEYLRNKNGIGELLDKVPDEFYNWVKTTSNELMEKYNNIEQICKEQFSNNFPDRKSNALYFLKCAYPSILFSMLDKKDYSDQIWKLIQPEYERPFSNNIE